MLTSHRRFLGLAAAGILAASAPAHAQTAGAPPPPHVRPDVGMRALYEEAEQRSPAIREVVDALEGYDVTVYIRTRVFPSSELNGRVALLSVTGSHRFLLIELACGRTRLLQMTTLGHELFHALEIASGPWIVDGRTLSAYYARIGMQTGENGVRQTFETRGAEAMGTRVRHEILTSSTRNSNGT